MGNSSGDAEVSKGERIPTLSVKAWVAELNKENFSLFQQFLMECP